MGALFDELYKEAGKLHEKKVKEEQDKVREENKVKKYGENYSVDTIKKQAETYNLQHGDNETSLFLTGAVNDGAITAVEAEKIYQNIPGNSGALFSKKHLTDVGGYYFSEATRQANGGVPLWRSENSREKYDSYTPEQAKTALSELESKESKEGLTLQEREDFNFLLTKADSETVKKYRAQAKMETDEAQTRDRMIAEGDMELYLHGVYFSNQDAVVPVYDEKGNVKYYNIDTEKLKESGYYTDEEIAQIVEFNELMANPQKRKTEQRIALSDYKFAIKNKQKIEQTLDNVKYEERVTPYITEAKADKDFEEIVSSREKQFKKQGDYFGRQADWMLDVINGHATVDEVTADARKQMKDINIDVSKYETDGRRIAEMTEEEKNIYRYYAMTSPEKDEYGMTKADKYFQALAPTLDKRVTIKHQERMRENAKENPVANYIATPIAKLIDLPTATGEFINQAFQEEYNPYAPGFLVRSGINAGHEAVLEDIKSPIGKFLYNVGLSIEDSALVMPLGVGGSILLGMDAAISTAQDVALSGGSKAEIISKGLAAGIFEAVFEKMSIERLFSPKAVGSLKDGIITVLKQGGFEASEELATSIANIITDNVLSGGESQFNSLVEKYVSEGLSVSDAQSKAFMEMVGEVGIETLSGFVSGLLFGTAGASGSYIQAKSMGNAVDSVGNTQSVIDYGLMQGEDTSAFKRASELSGEANPKSAKVGALLQQLVIDKQITKAEAQRLVSEGLDGAPLSEGEQAFYYAGANGISALEAARMLSDLNVDSERAIKAWQKGAESKNQKTAKTLKSDTSAPTVTTKYARDISKAITETAGATVNPITRKVKPFEVKTKETSVVQNDGNVVETPAVQNAPVKAVKFKGEAYEQAKTYKTEANAKDFEYAYTQGFNRVKPSEDINLEDSAISAAYLAGVSDSRAVVSSRANFEARTPGLNLANTVSRNIAGTLDDSTRATINNIGKKLGVEIMLTNRSNEIAQGNTKHSRNSSYNFKNGVVTINVDEIHIGLKGRKLKKNELVRFILAHEGTHRLQETSPEAYAEMEKIALSKSNMTLEEYMKKWNISDEAEARGEIVADYFGDLLSTKAEVKALLNENRSLWDKILEVINWLIYKLKGTGIAYNDIAEARELFRQALNEADATVWGAEVRSDGETVQARSEKDLTSEKKSGYNNREQSIESGVIDGIKQNSNSKKLGQFENSSEVERHNRMGEVGQVQSPKQNTPKTKYIHRSGVSAEAITSSELTAEQAALKEQNKLEGMLSEFYVKAIENGEEQSEIFLTENTIYYPDADFEKNDISIKNGVASFTENRFNGLIWEYSVPSGGQLNQNYAQAYVSYISPSDFLSLTAMNENAIVKDTKKYGKLDVDILKNNSVREGMYLEIDFEDGVVTDHNGRHRMVMLRDAGVEKVAIVIKPLDTESNKYNTQKMTNVSVTGQSFAKGKAIGKVTLSEIIPLSPNYRNEVREKFVDNKSDIRYSRSEPEKTFAKGEAPRRDIDVPSEVGGKKVMRGARTTAEAEGINEDYAFNLVEEIRNGNFTYEVSSNKAVALKATNEVNENYDQAKAKWDGIIMSGKRVTPEDIALGEALLVEASHRRNVEETLKINAEVAMLATEAGQVVQAMRILKRLSPDGQLRYLEVVTDRINAERQKTKGKKYNRLVESENEVAKANKKYQEADKKVKNLEKKSEEILNTINQLQSELESEDRIANLEEQEKALKKEIALLKKELAKESDASGKEKIREQIKLFEEDIKENASQLKDALDEKSRLVSERNAMGKELTAIKNAKKATDNAVEKLAGDMALLENEIADLDSQLEKATKFKKELEEELSKLRKERRTIKDKIKRKGDSSEKAIAEIESLENEIAELKEKLEVANTALNEVTEKRNALREERNKLREKLKRREGAIERETTRTKEITNQIEQLLDDLYNADIALEQAKANRKAVDEVRQKVNELARYAQSKAGRVVLPDDLKAKILQAQNEDELKAAMEIATDYIAANVRTTWAEKIRAWRYLAMLGNLRTIFRNFAGNVFMNIPVAAKNVVALPMEAAFVPINNAIVRAKANKMAEKGISQETIDSYLDRSIAYKTQTLKVFKKRSEDIKKFVKESWDTNLKVAMEGGKYDSTSMADEIESKRVIFKNKGIEAWRKVTNWAMESGDLVFVQFNYKQALTRFMLANNLNPDTITQAERAKAEAYAIKEAQEATFRDKSKLAESLNTIKKTNWATELLLGGLFPFTKTPINVMKRSFEYSPLGIFNMASDIVEAVKGTKNVTDVINSAAKMVSGSALVAIGAVLAAQGLLRSTGDDEDEEYDYLAGEQDYAITIGDKRYTIDWASPAAIPLLLGASMYESYFNNDGGVKKKYFIDENGKLQEATAYMNFVDSLNKAMTLFNPVFEATYLSGFADAIETGSQFSSMPGESIIAFGISSVLSFGKQFIPTVVGQVARIIDPIERRNNEVDQTSGIPRYAQKGVAKIKNSIPWLRESSTPYVDAWGRIPDVKDELKDYFWSAVENLISPGFYQEVKEDDTTKELWRLQNTEDGKGKNVFPDAVGNSYTQTKDKIEYTYVFNPEQKNKRQIAESGAYREFAETFLNSDIYSDLTDAERSKVLGMLNSYSEAEGIKAVYKDFETGNSTVQKMYAAEAEGISPEAYALWKVAKDKADKPNKNGNMGTYTNSEKDEAIRILMKQYGIELTPKQRTSLKKNY